MFFYAWCVVVCPLAGWYLAVFWAHGEGGLTKFILLFAGVPGALALVGSRFFGRRWLEASIGVVLAAGLGGLTWFLTILWLVSQGFFE